MFKRLIYEEWHQILPVLSFLLTFAVFAVLFVRALLMRRDRAQHLASLPLESQGEGRRYE